MVSAYKKYIRNRSSVLPSTSATHGDKLPHATIKRKQPLKKVKISKDDEKYDSSSSILIPKFSEEILQHLEDANMNESNDSIFPGLQILQPESTSKPQPDHVSLAQLSNSKVLKPLPVTITRVLDEKIRSRCLLELSDENTFLTDITINAFSAFKWINIHSAITIGGGLCCFIIFCSTHGPWPTILYV